MKASDDVETQLAQAAQHFERKEYCETLRVLTDCEDELGDNGCAWQLRGRAHFAVGEYQKARAALEHATLLVPLDTAAQCRLADCYMRTGRREVAGTIYLHLATLEALSEDTVESVAVGLGKVGEYETALSFCLSGIARFGSSHVLHHTASDMMRRLKYGNDEILPLAAQAHTLQPDNLSYRIAYAKHLIEAGHAGEAAAILRPVDPEAVECIASLHRLRRLYEQLDDREAADHCSARLLQIGYEVSSSYRPPKEDR